ncbi:MAG: hypothetical protein OEV44_00820 [Spirochaetota bacterium]|nr:hypothetical protein [Spirochaetota bacterium]
MTKENKEFPQTELQTKILDFWSVRGYNEVYAILGNLNVSLRTNPKYASLGLSYIYLEQFWKQAQSELISELDLIEINHTGTDEELKWKLRNFITKHTKK